MHICTRHFAACTSQFIQQSRRDTTEIVTAEYSRNILLKKVTLCRARMRSLPDTLFQNIAISTVDSVFTTRHELAQLRYTT
jgi:hypothetical protein